jgi:quinol monooxygenase YgiN
MRRTLMAALAAALPVLAGQARAEVVLINTFEVSEGSEEAVVAAWEEARDFLSKEPGYVSTALHQSLSPDARFRLVNVAVWESEDAFRAATGRMNAAGVFPKIEGLRLTPALYRVIRGDEPPQTAP